MGITDDDAVNATEQRLLDCALSLFAEKGYAATSVREIIEAAGVTRPVLYYYCNSKAGLFSRLVQSRLASAYLGLASLLSLHATCSDRLRAIMGGSFTFCARDPRIPRLMFQLHSASPDGEVAALIAELTAARFGVIAEVMRDGLRSGQLQGGDAESLALAFCCLMDQHINVLVRLPEPESRLTEGLADGLVDLFLNGCGTGERSQSRTLPFTAAAAGEE